ncbi:hypothetical protein [Halopiger xanaduensis]|uniref:Uncharacterized protein n=1 Tax=Halopiger xanaduensis (strain DSM 18323 / JCM 14033 / SH-6) TaxID=797210 RepID=F8DBD2_HALXS|nr:hypothetical protein [Halopiger xanaduensis]AEH35912.1 hypothetical protein Halxa_1279 [Halopiger xanaduensis SH-6]
MTDHSERRVDSTHELVVRTAALEGDDRHLAMTAIDAAATPADRCWLRLEDEAFAGAYPARTERLRDAFECVRTDGSLAAYRAPATDDALGIVRSLLTVPSWHGHVALESVRLERSGAPYLSYDPDHRNFDLDAETAADAVDAVATALEGTPAGVVSTEPRRWTVDGTPFELAGASLCYETDGPLGTSSRACFRCSRVADIDVEPAHRRLTLEWTDPPDAPRPIAALGGVLERLGPERPTTMRVDSRAGFEAARDGLTELLTAVEN